MQRLLAQLGQAVGSMRTRRQARDEEDVEYESGMARAVFEEDVATVAALLLRGVDAAASDRGQRPLLLALLRNERTEVAELLVAAGADPSAEDGHGLTPLHWLAQRRADAAVLTPLVALMHSCGADLAAREKLYGAAPLAWSGWHGCIGAATALLTAGSDVATTDNFRATACHWAVTNGHEETATLLRAALVAREAVARPVPRASAAEAAEARRALQRKHGVAMERQARCDAAVAVRLLALACEELTGKHAPALVRELLGVMVMRQRFTLWEPATKPRI